jgi:hypothetical protein
MRMGASVRGLSLAAPVARIPSDQERGHAERQALYQSERWRRERRAYLQAHPYCVDRTTGKVCGRPATVVDHRDGHQRPDWRERFWDQRTWQPLCRSHHNPKCGHELAAWKSGGNAAVPQGMRYAATPPASASPRDAHHDASRDDGEAPRGRPRGEGV